LIYYLVTRAHAYTVAAFVQGWGKALAGRILVAPYDAILAGNALPEGGVYVFSDLDRLTADERERLGAMRERLQGRVLNDPQRSLQRYELLAALHANGVNAFRAYRAGETPARLPVFLRPEVGFLKTAPQLLDTAPQVPAGRLAVEFCDTVSADGVYRKYGAYVVGERIMPRHLFFSRDWLVKGADLRAPDYLAEELAYLRGNPHATELLAICRAAHIGWGRVDYSLLDGRIQVWEINTNPLFVVPGIQDGREEAHRIAARGIVEALLALE
jgi:hypothetical protein